jgi:hypothetical protein
VNGRIDGAFGATRGWSTLPLEPTTHQVRIFMGDAEAGPLVWLFDGPPIERDDGATHSKHYAHLHHTPTFRMALGDELQQLLLNNRWYGPGEYFLLDANKRYSDPHSFAGYRELLVFADRRGLNPTSKDNVGQSEAQLLARNNRLFGDFGPGLSRLHTCDDEAVAGAAMSTRALDHGRKSNGCIYDQADWATLSDGSRVAAAFMGDGACGPIVIMTENAPGAEEPAGTCGADLFRLIVRGNCSIGGEPLDAGAFMACEAGAALDAVVHGPQGSTQVLVVADRRFWAPVAGGAPAGHPRLEEIGARLHAHVPEPNVSAQD